MTGTVHVVVDVESDGPAPALYSMVSLGAVVCAPPFKTTFGLQTRPISQDYVPEALAISGITRAVHETYPDPADVVPDFVRWFRSLGRRPVMWSDNPAFDWQWVNFYLHRFAGENPFGYSARRIGDLYCGILGNIKAQSEWKKLRKTKHTHDPIDDATGNAEALYEIMQMLRARDI